MRYVVTVMKDKKNFEPSIIFGDVTETIFYVCGFAATHIGLEAAQVIETLFLDLEEEEGNEYIMWDNPDGWEIRMKVVHSKYSKLAAEAKVINIREVISG